MAQIRTSSGLQISYDGKKRGIIERNLLALIESVRAGDLSVGFHVSPSLHVLADLIGIESIEDNDVKRHVIFTAAIQLQSLAPPTLSDLIKAIGLAGQNYLKRPMQLYHVVLPLNVESGALSEVDKFSIWEVDLIPATWADIQRIYAHGKLVEDIQGYLKENMPDDLWNWSGTPLVTRIMDRVPSRAFQKSFGAYEFLRAIFNFIHDRNPFQFQRREPLAQVTPSAGYGVFLSDGSFAEAFVDDEHLSFQRHVLSQINLKEVLRLLAMLWSDGKPNGAKKTFIEALLAYNRGLDATNWQNAYLSLWQSLEIMTTFDLGKQYRKKDVVERTKILSKKDEVIDDFLNLCAERRNVLVHRGQFSEDGQSEVLLLKAIVKNCLERFLHLVKDFSTHEQLSDFFHNSLLTSNRLNERRQVIEKILENNNRANP